MTKKPIPWSHNSAKLPCPSGSSLGGRRGHETSVLGEAQFGVAFLHVALDGERGAASDRGPDTAALGQARDGQANGDRRVRPHLAGSPHRRSGDRFVAKAIWWGMDVAHTMRHVRALLPLDGHYALAQRFAIDWEQAGGDGRLVTGDLKEA